MRVSIIGVGLQCQRRAPVILASVTDELISVSSSSYQQTKLVASKFACLADESWQDTVNREDVDAVIVCTPPSSHAEISIAAMKAGKHVLCEKPLASTVEDAIEMVRVAKATGRVLKCGLNHRHHPAIWEARKRLEAGDFGQLFFARMRYGICGRPGYESEWRADPRRAAGGQFIEQGTHGIDLIRWFMGEISEVACMTSSHYFKAESGEDDGFAIFRCDQGGAASMHTSLVQWQNLFSFEVSGGEGYARIEGLGGSYGTETLYIGKRDSNAPFQDHVVQYRGGDISWRDEWGEFVSAIKEGREPIGGGMDGVAAMRVAFSAYQAEKSKKSLTIEKFQDDM